jgi:hypothetical protein
MAVAVFNLANFQARYPQFNAVSPTRLAALFVEAGLYLSNTDCSPIQDLGRRGMLLNMLVAHISSLSGDLSADGQAQPVGRVSQASEGTVSASFEMNAPTPGTGPWFQQTTYGAAFWAATANLRGMRYRPRPTDPNQGRRW